MGITRTMARLGATLLLLLGAGCALAASGDEKGQDQAGIESTVARLSDQDVRALLIDELRRAAHAERREEFNPATFAYRLQRDIATLSEEVKATLHAVRELPAVFPTAWARFTADREDGGALWFIVALTVSMGTGGIASVLLRSRVTPELRKLDLPPPESTRRKALILLSDLGLHLIYVLCFAVVALAVFVLAFDENPKDRVAFLFYLLASVIFLSVIGFSNAFHSPRRAAVRLPLYSDRDALRLHRTVLIAVGFGAFAYFTCALFGTLGILGFVHQLFLILVGTITALLIVVTILAGRRAISHDLASGAPANSARGIFSRVWPPCFALFVPLLLAGLVVRELLYDFVPYGAALFTVAVLAVVPSFDALLYRENKALSARDEEVRAALVHAARLAVLMLVLGLLCVAWRVNPFSIGGAMGSAGAQFASDAIGFLLICAVGFLAWQIVNLVVNRRLAKEGSGDLDFRGDRTRLDTVLPILRTTLQITIITLTALLALAQLGVNITPLLAGAGVFGLAIGFGAQTLVKDVVSGGFFLLDDALRVGEFIEIGDTMGQVERISIRSLQLRDIAGPIHIIPYGEISNLTNLSRDWASQKPEFTVPFDTNLDKVAEIFNRIGEEMMEHPKHGPNFIEPFEWRGAGDVTDVGVVVRGKFVAKPGTQFKIRREITARVRNAFEDNGIEFARREVRVQIPEDINLPPQKRAAIASAANEAVESAAREGAAQDGAAPLAR